MTAPGSDGPNTGGSDGKPVILVAEDEILIRMTIAEYLRDCGYHVIEAGNGREAIALFEADLEIDVVFSDVQMPGAVDGFALAQWIRANRPGVNVILTSGVVKASAVAVDLCRDGPMMQKPYEPEAVGRRIGQLLAARARRKPE